METDLIFEETAERVKRGMVIEIASPRPLEVPSRFRQATQNNKGNARLDEEGNLTSTGGTDWTLGDARQFDDKRGCDILGLNDFRPLTEKLSASFSGTTFLYVYMK